ncbi:MAG: fumarylacetoacetate hydrolase family protein [Fusobacteria bacterium]|nr:fumarylacetoacetate hydrolase family protein [Fusobacteriota bacterium]
MKILRVLNGDKIIPAIEKNGKYYTLESVIKDFHTFYLNDEMLGMINNLQTKDLQEILVEQNCIMEPIGGVKKLVCIGLNSLKHIEEMKLETPEDPTFFMKATSSITGPYSDIIYQNNMRKVDWEAELAVVIGKKGKNIKKENAYEYILGYTCLNDVSDRYWQFEKSGGQFTKGKSFDTFAPLGPYIVTKDEIANPHDLKVKLKVNGLVRQDFNTDDYLFKIDEIISYLSELFTLEIGDVISMGTGNGVAKFWNESYLVPGDNVVLEIEKIGFQSSNVKMEA